MKKRVLAMATVLAILCSLMPASVIAAEEHAATYVAQIGNTKYETLEDAVAAGGEITLLSDVNIDTTIHVTNTVVLDLNGKTITGTPAAEKAYSVISNTGKLTINNSVGNGKILCDHTLPGSTSYAVNTIVNSGTLIINGGTIENKSTASNQIGYAIDNNSTSYNTALVINGGTITASGSNYYDGIRQFCNNTNVENSVTVTGGSVSSIWLQNPSDGETNKNTKEVKGAVTITGGTVNALYLEPSTGFQASVTGGHVGMISYFQTAEGRDLTGFITGGTFGVDPTPYAAAGCSISKSNTNTWSVYTPVAQVGSATFGSLADAVAAAAKGDIVKLLKNVSGSGIVIDKDVTIDFGSYTYTLTEPPVGSTGTETLGFQILQGNTVTLQNGRLTVDKNYATNYAVLIQNYANLTLRNMNLDGTNLDRHSIKDYDYSYVLSNNSGSVRLEGNMHITANNDGDAYAFDVCKYGSYEAPTVIVETTGRITGKIEVTPGLEDNLIIESGTFNTNPSAYLADGKIATLNSGLFYVVDKPANAPDVSVDVTAKDTTTDDVKIDSSVTLEKNEAEALQNAITNAVNKEETKQDLQNAANNLQHDANVVGSDDTAARDALKNKEGYDAEAEVEVQVKPYLQVTVTGYSNTSASDKSITLDIKAMYDVVAVQTSSEKEISATIQAGEELKNVSTAITITIPLPDGFVESGTKTVYVYHTKTDGSLYIHDATVSADGKTATFVNDQGFSTFEVKTEKTELFDLDAANVKFGTTFDMNFVFSKDKITDQSVLEDCYAKIIRKYADGTKDHELKIPFAQWGTDESGFYWKITYSGLNAKEMCDTICVQIFDKDDNALSNVWTDSIQAYASRVFNKAGTSAKDYKMIISMLDYGATAQWYYDYNQMNLANALVTDVHRTKANEAV